MMLIIKPKQDFRKSAQHPYNKIVRNLSLHSVNSITHSWVDKVRPLLRMLGRIKY